jgi:hypothetical protein
MGLGGLGELAGGGPEEQAEPQPSAEPEIEPVAER